MRGVWWIVSRCFKIAVLEKQDMLNCHAKELAETIRSHLDLQKETPNAGKPGISRDFKYSSGIFKTISRCFKSYDAFFVWETQVHAR